MTKSILYLAASLVAISSIASAEDLSTATAPLPPGTFTTSAHSDEWKIRNALSGGPTTIAEHATVIDWPTNMMDGMSHTRVLRKGTNGWTCLPDMPGRPQHDPMCVDETTMKWLTATLAGKKPDIDRAGLSFMLDGEAREQGGEHITSDKDPSQVKKWVYIGPHIMIVLPDSDKDALRDVSQHFSNDQPFKRVFGPADVGTPWWLIPIAKAGDRIEEVPMK
ncbi:hypothetical protein [Trinickia mobilis]|uniref:hypothetical protein n=1 Tax=Trinickia mobilis TaxID=2816356 RepID=UPI001A8DE95C|nr:hypothetical protein [Trinickia mobilis]